MPGKLSFDPIDVVDSSTLEGKVLCGYQGWFRTPNDGGHLQKRTVWNTAQGKWTVEDNRQDQTKRWSSWNRNGVPKLDDEGKQLITVEMYPDI